MSAVIVPADCESSRKIPAVPIEGDADDFVLPGVSRPSVTKKLLAVALVAAVAVLAARKVHDKVSPAVSAPVVAAAVAPALTQAPIEPLQPTPPSTPSSAANTAEPEQAMTTAPPSDHGTLDTANAMAGRRVFVDGHVVGQTPAAMLVKCGPHKVKVGSAGHTRKIDIPCGGSIAVGDF